MEEVKSSTIPPVNPGTFSVPDDGTLPELLGGYCPSCGTHRYPRPRCCPSCLGELEIRTVGRRGRIYSFTVVRTKPPMGLPEPYSVGLIDLDETGLRVFGLLEPERMEDLCLGARVHLTVRALGHDGRGETRLRPCFALEDSEGGT
jgi:uncharacterized OB-fold protein